MKTIIRQNKPVIIGVVVGAMAGWAYWKFYGCSNGCTIKSNSYLMTIYGSVMGGLLFSFFKKDKS